MKDPYDSLVPIFRAEKTPSRVQQHGTGVYFKLNGDVYLLTAAHVIDGSEPGQLLVPGPDGLVPVAGSMYASFVGDENRKNDNSDFALFRLEAGCKKALNHLQPVSADKNRATYNKLGVRLLLNFRVPGKQGHKQGRTALFRDL